METESEPTGRKPFTVTRHRLGARREKGRPDGDGDGDDDGDGGDDDCDSEGLTDRV